MSVVPAGYYWEFRLLRLLRAFSRGRKIRHVKTVSLAKRGLVSAISRCVNLKLHAVATRKVRAFLVTLETVSRAGLINVFSSFFPKISLAGGAAVVNARNAQQGTGAIVVPIMPFRRSFGLKSGLAA